MGSAVPLAAAVSPEAAGLVVAALAVAGAYLLPTPRARAAAMLLALALMPVLLLAELWDSPALRGARERPLLLAAAALTAFTLAVLGALLLRARPRLLPLLVAAALPFRLPVETGGQTANLLLPLYLVISSGALAYAGERLRPGAPRGQEGPKAGRVELLVLAVIALYAAQAAYSSDFEQALKNVAFFYVPFALLLKLLLTVTWTPRVARDCGGVAVVLALAFAAVGFVEYATRQVLWNPKVIEANQFESYFRVNSLFFDPNIYGRFLAVVMVGVAASLLWSRGRSSATWAAVLLAVLWAGLVLTFSQSSFAALLVGLVVLGGIRWGPRRAALASAAVVATAVVALLAFPQALKLDLGSARSLDDATSGRLDLLRGGIGMFAERPVGGFGSGSFSERFRDREAVGSERAASASHTIPITIAAEQGAPGLVLYLLLLGALFATAFAGMSGARGPAPPELSAARAFTAAALAALVAHTLLYAAFLEDPIVWVLLAAAIGLRVSAASAGAGAPPAASPAPVA